jgi:hypothetical protein
MVPVVGEPVDVINGVIYAVRGDYVNAGFSVAAAIPIVGNVSTSTKMVIKGAKSVDTAIATAKAGTILLEKSKVIINGIEIEKPAYKLGEHVGAALKYGKTELPVDHFEVFQTSIPFKNKNTGKINWWGRNEDGTYYRFSDGNDGTLHFSGTFKANAKEVPIEIRRLENWPNIKNK